MTANINILLIDKRISHYEAIIAAVDPALSKGITFDYYTDTFETLKERIVSGSSGVLANSVGLVQHNYKMPTFKMVDAQTTSSTIEQVEIQDSELSTWAPLKEFIEWCKTELSTAHFDMMACALYSNPDWKYVIDTLSAQTGVEIRASTDDTGSSSLGGNWFLESHVGINLKEVYFNDSIDGYIGLLDSAMFTSSFYADDAFLYTTQIPTITTLPSRPTRPTNPTLPLLAPTLPPRPSLSGYTTSYGVYNELQGNGGSVVSYGDDNNSHCSFSKVSTQLQSGVAYLFSSGAALKTNGNLVLWGNHMYSANIMVPSTANLSSGVCSMCRNGGYNICALKNDGSVVFWGNFSSGFPAFPSSDLSSGVNFVAASYEDFACLKSDGSIRGWGNEVFKNSSSVPAFIYPAGSTLNSGFVKLISIGYPNAFAAIKTDGSVVFFGGTSASTSYLSNPTTFYPAGSNITSGVVDVFATVGQDYQACFIALKSDGSLVAWGLGASSLSTWITGKTAVKIIKTSTRPIIILSDGTYINYLTNNSEGTFTNIVDVLEYNGRHFFLRSDGTVAWRGGENLVYYFGIGTSSFTNIVKMWNDPNGQFNQGAIFLTSTGELRTTADYFLMATDVNDAIVTQGYVTYVTSSGKVRVIKKLAGPNSQESTFKIENGSTRISYPAIRANGAGQESATSLLATLNDGTVCTVLKTPITYPNLFVFDGTTYATCPYSQYSTALDLVTGYAGTSSSAGGNAFTIETWYYQPSQTLNSTIVDRGNSCYLFQVSPNANTITANLGCLGFSNTAISGSWLYATSAVVTSGGWTHIAMTREGTSYKFYINGVLKQTMTGPATLTRDDGVLGIGTQLSGTTTGGNYTNAGCSMYDLRLWCVSRTDDQIKSYMNVSVDPSSFGLVANYLFNDNENIFRDRTRNGFHCTIGNYVSTSWKTYHRNSKPDNSLFPSSIGVFLNPDYTLVRQSYFILSFGTEPLRNLVKTDFTGANLTGINFTGRDLTGANLSGANLTNVNFSNAILTGITVNKSTNFTGASFANAVIYSVIGTVNPSLVPTNYLHYFSNVNLKNVLVDYNNVNTSIALPPTSITNYAVHFAEYYNYKKSNARFYISWATNSNALSFSSSSYTPKVRFQIIQNYTYSAVAGNVVGVDVLFDYADGKGCIETNVPFYIDRENEGNGSVSDTSPNKNIPLRFRLWGELVNGVRSSSYAEIIIGSFPVTTFSLFSNILTTAPSWYTSITTNSNNSRYANYIGYLNHSDNKLFLYGTQVFANGAFTSPAGAATFYDWATNTPYIIPATSGSWRSYTIDPTGNSAFINVWASTSQGWCRYVFSTNTLTVLNTAESCNNTVCNSTGTRAYTNDINNLLVYNSTTNTASVVSLGVGNLRNMYIDKNDKYVVTSSYDAAAVYIINIVNDANTKISTGQIVSNDTLSWAFFDDSSTYCYAAFTRYRGDIYRIKLSDGTWILFKALPAISYATIINKYLYIFGINASTQQYSMIDTTDATRTVIVNSFPTGYDAVLQVYETKNKNVYCSVNYNGVPTIAHFTGFPNTFSNSSGIMLGPSMNYSNANLSNYNLSNKNFTSSKFTNATITNVDFTNSNLTTASFSGTVDYSTADLTGATLTGATFSDSLFDYTLDANNNATVVKYRGSASLVFPEKVSGTYTITAIGDNMDWGLSFTNFSFSATSKLVSIGASGGPQNMGIITSPFGPKNFFPPTLTRIGNQAFYYRTVATSPEFPTSNDFRFAAIILPPGVNFVGTNAFSQFSVLVKIKPTLAWNSALTTPLATGSTFTYTATSSGPVGYNGYNGSSPNSNMPVYYASTNTSIATINSSTGLVTLVGLGTVTFTANQDSQYSGEVSFYSADTLTSATLTVTKGTPTLSAFSIASKNVGDAAFQVTAPTSQNTVGAFHYTSSSSSVATITDAGMITIVNVGSATITVNQDETTLFNAPTAITATLTVGKGTPTLSFPSQSITKTIGDANFNVVATAPALSTGAFHYTFSNLIFGGIAGTSFNRIAMSSNGQYISVIYSDPVNYIYVSNNYGLTLTRYAFADAGLRIAMSSSGQYQAYNNANGVFISENYGGSFAKKGTGNTGNNRVEMSDSGQHIISLQSQRKICTSLDYGSNWALKMSDAYWEDCAITADGSIQFALEWGSGKIFKTTDNWATNEVIYSSGIFYQLNTMAISSDGKYLACNRAISSNYGVTWAATTIPGSTNIWTMVSISASGKIQALGNSEGIYFSIDYGATWNKDAYSATNALSLTTMRVSRDGSFIAAGFGTNLIRMYIGGLASANIATLNELSGSVSLTGGGSIIISASQDPSTSYNASTTSAKTLLIVNKVTPVLSNVTISKTYGDAAFQVTAPAGSSTSTGTMSYAFLSGDTTVASITGTGLITVNKVGAVVFSASQNETSGYNAPTPVTVTLTVSKATPTLIDFTIAPKYIGDSVFTLTAPTGSSVSGGTMRYAVKYTYANMFSSIAAGSEIMDSAASLNGMYQTVTTYRNGFWLSANYGATWINKSPSSTAIGSVIYKAVSMSSSGQYQSVCEYGGYIYVSNDYGATWTKPATITAAKNFMAIKMSDSGLHQTCVADTNYIYTSSDSGATWTQKTSIGTKSYYDVAMTADGSIQYAVVLNGGGILKSTDKWSTSTSVNTGLAQNKVGSIEVSSTGTYITIVSFTDTGVNDPVILSKDGGSTWTSFDPDGSTRTGWTSSNVGMSADGRVQMLCYNTAALTGGLYFSIDYGTTWTNDVSINNNPCGVSVSRDGTYMLSGSNDLVIYNIFSDMATIPASKKVATIVELTGQVTIVGAGLVTVSASQDSTTNYNAPTPISAKFLVNKVTPVLSNVTVSKTYGTTVGPITIPTLAVTGFPVLNSLTNWIIDIGFTTTGGANSWRALLGSMYNAVDSRGWGIWVSNSNKIFYSHKNLTYEFTNGSVSINVAYNLNITKVGTSITFNLTNVSTQVSSTYTATNVTDPMGLGPVSIGGWVSGIETFPGTINYVVVKDHISIGHKVFQLTAPAGSSSSGGTMRYAFLSGDTTVASVTELGIITVNKVGTVVFSASQDETSSYFAPTPVTATLTVSKATPILNNVTVSKMFGDAAFQVTAPEGSSVSGGTMHYIFSSGDTTVASITDAGLITVNKAGTVVFSASQDFTTNYNSPLPVSVTLTVAKATPTLSGFTIPPKTYTYGTDTTFQVTATTSSGSNGTFRYSSNNSAVASINASGTVTINGAGSATFTVNQDSTDNYNAPVPLTAILTVIKGTPTIAVSNLSKSTVDPTFTFASSSASDGSRTFSSNTPGVATIHPSSGLVTIIGIVGTTTITVSQVATTNYNAPSDATAILTVTKGTPTLSAFSIASKIFGDLPFAVTAPASRNTVGTFHYTSDTPGVATITDSGTITIVGAGSTTITANQDATTNFNAPTPITAILTVAKATPTIVVSNITKSSIDPTFTFARSTASDGALTFSSSSEIVAKINSVSGVVTVVSAGTATITVSQVATTNYNAPTNATATLTVTAGTLTNAVIPSGADLSGKNLSGASLVGATLANVVLSNSNLNGANFSGANVAGTDFTNASIVGATNLPEFSTKQKLELLYNANNAGANISQLQFSAPLSVSELNAALSVPIPELSSVNTEFLVAAPVYDVSNVKTVTIAPSSISTVNNTSFYIPLNKGETVKINGASFTLNASNQLLDNNGVVLKLIVVNGYPFKIYTGSVIAVNISSRMNNVTFDDEGQIKLYDVVNSMVTAAMAQEASSGLVAGYVSELYSYLNLSYVDVYNRNNPVLDATVTSPVFSSYASITNTFSYSVNVTGPAANPLSLDKTKYKFIVESVNTATNSRTTVSQPTWDSVASPTTIVCASLLPLTSYSVIVTPTLFNSTSNLKSLLPVKTFTLTTPLDYGLISSITFTKEGTSWYFNFQYSGYASLTSFTMGLRWIQGGGYGGSITQNFSSVPISNGTNKYLITDTQNYLNVGGPSLIANVVTATIDYVSGTATKQNITTFVPNPIVGGPYVVGISNFNTDIYPGTCTATIPASLHQQIGGGKNYVLRFVEKDTGTITNMSSFDSASSSSSVTIPLTLYGKTFTCELLIQNLGYSYTGEYVILPYTSNLNYFTVPNPAGLFPTITTVLDHKGMNWNVGGATDDVRLFKVNWLTTTAGLNVSSPNYVSKVRVNIKISGESSYRFTGVYNYADGFGYSMFHSSVRTSQGQAIGTWVVVIRSENSDGTITTNYSTFSQYGGVTIYGNYYTLNDLAAEAGTSTILYGVDVASTFAVSNLALSGAGYTWNSSTLKYATSVAFTTAVPYGTSTTTHKHKVELINPDTTKITLGSFVLDNSAKTVAVSPLNPSSTHTVKVTLVDSAGNDVTGVIASSQTLTLTVPAAQ